MTRFAWIRAIVLASLFLSLAYYAVLQQARPLSHFAASAPASAAPVEQPKASLQHSAPLSAVPAAPISIGDAPASTNDSALYGEVPDLLPNSPLLDDLYRTKPFLEHEVMKRAMSKSEVATAMSLIGEMDMVMRNQNITYIIAYGSLLGSFMMHDILPWDDEIDLLVQNSEYDKLVSGLESKKWTDRVGIGKQQHAYAKRLLKLYLEGTPKAGGSAWGWPFLDVAFFEENDTHVTTVNREPVTLTREEFYPLHRRPFGSLWLPAPRDTRAFLALKYKTFFCETHTWNHRKESFTPHVTKVSCDDLKATYPFVRRERNGSATVEKLVLGNRTLYRLSSEEPLYPLGDFELVSSKRAECPLQTPSGVEAGSCDLFLNSTNVTVSLEECFLRVPVKESPTLRRAMSQEETCTAVRLLSRVHRILDRENVSFVIARDTLLGSYMMHTLLPWIDVLSILVNKDDSERFVDSLQNDELIGVAEQSKAHEKVVKIFFKDSPPAGGSKWKWPFIDSGFFSANETHVSTTSTQENIVLKREDFYPLQMRPVASLWLPAPRDSRQLLLARTQGLNCQTHHWNHKAERPRSKKAEIDCQKLVSDYPFVHRWKSLNSTTTERLDFDGKVLYHLQTSEADHT